MMNYYQQPQIPNYFQPQYDRLAQLQQYQQTMQPQPIPQPQNFINGKVVDSLEVVKATDIPITNEPYIFYRGDGAEIYVKKWNNNGTTSIVTYKPFLDDFNAEPNNLPQDESKPLYSQFKPIVDDIMSHIDERFDKIEKNFANSKPRTAKKECEE